MTPFTDEDLETLKRLSCDSDTIYGFNVWALLARLEAAEKCMHSSSPMETQENWKAWREAAGK